MIVVVFSCNTSQEENVFSLSFSLSLSLSLCPSPLCLSPSSSLYLSFLLSRSFCLSLPLSLSICIIQEPKSSDDQVQSSGDVELDCSASEVRRITIFNNLLIIFKWPCLCRHQHCHTLQHWSELLSSSILPLLKRPHGGSHAASHEKARYASE